MAQQGCDQEGKFAIVTHGWKEGIKADWADGVIRNLLAVRGGCVIFMDYSRYANNPNYYAILPHFKPIAAVLSKKLKQINAPERTYMFGFSYGARLCTEAAVNYGKQLDSMDLCDPANPGFQGPGVKDPKLAAKNVRCINTSARRGTSKYNCHWNFRMGKCGAKQPGASSPSMGSHKMCPLIFNNTFTEHYAPNHTLATSLYECSSNRLVTASDGIRVGYSEVPIE